ncbi:Enoyl-[acyl-carrier-protein] reductase [NADH] [Micromonospora matsumotoense]|uniref:Enoyl-[acyl-carrier-protein] reductase [NADH] n=1 Tax=Micromonospora matsumotoense TaxID=121616 RepID=A0A1C5AXD5_9ACTN|nr:enoyl-ACP reductase FabI [Micromonospora matsumotoense]SCF49704.1 Enoyl-[acyl-carrier-protein] reductase [NADH] [Micromonospora matsumotoense]
MLLEGRRLLVTGALNTRSIAYAAAALAQQQGAEVVLTGFGRGLRITRRLAATMDPPCDVLECDVTRPEQLTAVADELHRRWGRLDGVLHAVAYAPADALGGNFLDTSWADAGTSLHVSVYSFAAFGRHFGPLLAAAGGGSLVGLDFDAGQAWPGYDWMGVAKAGLESCCRYLAHALGPQGTRVNLVAAGPLRTVAATSIPGFDLFESTWADRAPLGWDVQDASAVARTVCALWSDWLPAVTGEVLHVDGGAHAVAAGVGAPVVAGATR